VLPTGALRHALAMLLPRVLSVPAGQRKEWTEVVRRTLLDDLTDADVVSHFAVIADMIRGRVVRAEAYARWTGDVVVLAATNDPTQGGRGVRRLERLFGRPVEVISLGELGHTAPLMDPAGYAERVERALAAP
jgi:pimeloyl-ACP methyl ester carboxylesterase